MPRRPRSHLPCLPHQQSKVPPTARPSPKSGISACMHGWLCLRLSWLAVALNLRSRSSLPLSHPLRARQSNAQVRCRLLYLPPGRASTCPNYTLSTAPSSRATSLARSHPYRVASLQISQVYWKPSASSRSPPHRMGAKSRGRLRSPIGAPKVCPVANRIETWPLLRASGLTKFYAGLVSARKQRTYAKRRSRESGSVSLLRFAKRSVRNSPVPALPILALTTRRKTEQA